MIAPVHQDKQRFEERLCQKKCRRMTKHLIKVFLAGGEEAQCMECKRVTKLRGGTS